jgi:hypothetical protein
MYNAAGISMNKIPRFTTAALVLVMGVTAYGQTEPLTKAEKDKLWAAAERIGLETPFRELLTVEQSASPDGPWEHNSYRIFEKILPNRLQKTEFRERDIRFRNGVAYQETIHIGDTIYDRALPNGEWRSWPRSTSLAKPSVVLEPSKIEYSKRPVPNEPRQTMIETTTSGGRTLLSSGQILGHWSKAQTWHDTKGRLLKVVRIHLMPDNKTYRRETVLYEYDPTIIITAPIP